MSVSKEGDRAIGVFYQYVPLLRFVRPYTKFTMTELPCITLELPKIWKYGGLPFQLLMIMLASIFHDHPFSRTYLTPLP